MNAAGIPILFRDDNFVILDKPPGLPVHAGPRGGASVEDWFPLLSRRRTGPWLVHRLDADTSGCLVVALRRPALLAAQALFAAGQARKTYWAIVAGAPPSDRGIIEAPLLKRSRPRSWCMVVDPAGQSARTEWLERGRAPGRTWLELHPTTGRTHQIRAHCAHLGCPILHDPVYGDPLCIDPAGGRLALLARAIALPLDPPLAAEAPPPPHMKAPLQTLGWR